MNIDPFGCALWLGSLIAALDPTFDPSPRASMDCSKELPIKVPGYIMAVTQSGGENMDGTQEKPLFKRVSRHLGQTTTRRWWNLSEQVQRDARSSKPDASVPALHDAAEREPQAPVAPAFWLWAADGLVRAARHHDAVAIYDKVLNAAEASAPFDGLDFIGEALRHRAGALARLADVDGAVATYRELAARGERDALFRAGVVAERAGRLKQAIELYHEVADRSRSPDADSAGQLALRSAERLLRKDGVFTPAVLGIAELVESAVVARDGERLRRLTSPTHFAVGPGGGHFHFEDEDVIHSLCSDLTRSRPQRYGRGLQGTGGKRYLLTRGWLGKRFRGIVGFCFTHSMRGWEWTGVVITLPGEFWLDRWTPLHKATNQPLPFGLQAPWPAGRHFMAGGLDKFLIQSAAIAAALAVPIFGVVVAIAMLEGFSLTDCGFGTRGYYYNIGPTHSGQNAFAIDFTSYRYGVPYENISGGTPVLAAADGVVRFTEPDATSGDSSFANEVRINHDDPATGIARFVSRYMHLAGPGLLKVSMGMPVPVGRRLGVMNDTGNSVLDHLHFSIHDTPAGTAANSLGPSVRPSPMEGHTLSDSASGTCIKSTNVEAFVNAPSSSIPSRCKQIAAEIDGLEQKLSSLKKEFQEAEPSAKPAIAEKMKDLISQIDQKEMKLAICINNNS